MPDDLVALPKDEKLRPWWRSPGAGIDLGAFLDRPPPLFLPGWVQGWQALPHLKRGAILSAGSTAAFDRPTHGQAPLFALYFT